MGKVEAGPQLGFDEFAEPKPVQIQQPPVDFQPAESKPKPKFDPFGCEGGKEDKRYI